MKIISNPSMDSEGKASIGSNQAGPVLGERADSQFALASHAGCYLWHTEIYFGGLFHKTVARRPG